MSVARGSAARCAWVTHDELLSRRMPPHTWQPTIWVLRRTRLGTSAPLRPPVRLRRHAPGNESGSEKDFPVENWSSMTSDVEARSAGRIRRLTLAPSSPPTLVATDHTGAPASGSSSAITGTPAGARRTRSRGYSRPRARAYVSPRSDLTRVGAEVGQLQRAGGERPEAHR
jgi:hypothetical protein